MQFGAGDLGGGARRQVRNCGHRAAAPSASSLQPGSLLQLCSSGQAIRNPRSQQSIEAATQGVCTGALAFRAREH